MFASASRSCTTRSRQQSQRMTRRTPSTSIGFQPVSSQIGQGTLIEMTPQAGGAAELRLGHGFDLPHAFPGQMELIADLLQRPRLVVSEAEAEADDLPFLAVQVAQRFSDVMRIGLP